MSKKLVVKLLATVMAMTMVVGSGLTVFAVEVENVQDTCEHPASSDWQGNNHGKHEKICTKCSKVLTEEDCTYGEIWRNMAPGGDYEEGYHYHVCEVCGNANANDKEACQSVDEWSYDYQKHFKRCIKGPECHKLYYEAAHDTNGENGACSVCGFNTNYGDPSSSELPSVLPGESPTVKDEATQEKKASSSSKKEKDEKIKETSVSSSTPKVDVVEEINKALAKQLEETIKAEESIPVTSFASTTAVNAVPAEVKATATAGATYNLSQITTTQGFVAAVNKIAEANPGATSVTVYSSNPMAFSADVLTAVSNANKELVYTFNHKGHLYKITIPAGAKLDLNGNRYAGPLYIGAQLGTSVVLK